MNQLEGAIRPVVRDGGVVGGPGPRTADEFAAWVRPHWSAMVGLAHRLSGGEGDDALQEALGAAWRKRDQYDATRGTARAWLLAVVADQARKTWRVRRPVPTELSDGVEQARGDHDARLDLAQALGGLTERQRLAVELHYYVGLPLAEVAVVLDCAEGTVKSTLSDARRKLRAEMGEEYR